MARKLKVFRTPIGFHDAYVAAPSQQAALAAWGSDANLFARGVAELVTDPALTAEPLAHPGQVVKRSRGTAAEHFGALPKSAPVKAASASAKRSAPATRPKTAGPKAKAKTGAKPAPRPAPAPRKLAARPSRARLDAAEARLAKAAAEQDAARADLKRREEALRPERKRLDARYLAARDRLEDRLDTARAAYDRALSRWQSET